MTFIMASFHFWVGVLSAIFPLQSSSLAFAPPFSRAYIASTLPTSTA